MKKLLLILPLLAFCLPAQVQLQNAQLSNFQATATTTPAAGYVYKFDTGVGGTAGGCVTPAADSSGSTLIVVGVLFFVTQPTLSDSKGNTWTGLTAKIVSGNSCRIYYCVNPTVGSGHTFTCTGGDGTQFACITAIGFSGNAATPFDAEIAANQGGQTTLQPGSITPAQSAELFITLTSLNQINKTATINSGFTALSEQTSSQPQGYLAYKIKSDATAENPTWTYSGVCNSSAVMAAFK